MMAIKLDKVSERLPSSLAIVGVWVLLTVAAGVGAAHSPWLVLGAILCVPVLLMIGRPFGRLALVSLGALAALGGSPSSSLGVSKLIYSAGVGATALMALVQLRSVSSRWSVADARSRRRALSVSWWTAIAFAVSATAGFLRGNRPLDVVRDLSPYLLIVLTAIIVFDSADHVRSKSIAKLLLIVGVLGTALFSLYFGSVRGTSSLGISGLLASSSLCIMLFCYSVARALSAGQRQWRWIFLALLTITMGALTGSRSTLFLLLAIPSSMWLLQRASLSTMVRRTLRAFVGMLFVLPIILVGASMVGRSINLERALTRVLSGIQLQSRPGTSQETSRLERQDQARLAIATFSASPAIGAGPGHIFRIERRSSKKTTEGFTMDSIFVVPAKFGIVGSISLGLLLLSWFGLARNDWRRNGVSHWHATFLSFFVVQTVSGIVNPVVEDKAFGVAAILILAGMFADSRERASQAIVQSRLTGLSESQGGVREQSWHGQGIVDTIPSAIPTPGSSGQARASENTEPRN